MKNLTILSLLGLLTLPALADSSDDQTSPKNNPVIFLSGETSCQPQSVYNAKSSIKRKLEHSNRSLLSEIGNIYS